MFYSVRNQLQKATVLGRLGVFLGLAVSFLASILALPDLALAQESDEPIYGEIEQPLAGTTVELADADQFPFIVDVRAPGGCTGSVIRADLVLTAAHCVDTDDDPSVPFDISRSSVFIGNNRRGDGDLHSVRSITIHPEWDGNVNNGFDVAVVSLEDPTSVTPVRLAGPSHQSLWIADNWVRLVGFGATCANDPDGRFENCGIAGEEDATNDGRLRTARGVVENTNFSETVFTLRGDEGFTCAGDSGGPALVELTDGSFRQIGVSSWNNREDGTVCSNNRSGYARVGDSDLRSFVIDQLVNWTASPNPSKVWWVGDFNGDGLDDVVRRADPDGVATPPGARWSPTLESKFCCLKGFALQGRSCRGSD